MSEVVYFIQGETSGEIKIGYSANVKTRLISLRSKRKESLTLLGCAHGNRSLERALHREFAADRGVGEWFKASPELIARIASLCVEIDLAKELSGQAGDPRLVLARHWVILIEDCFVREGAAPLKDGRIAIAKMLGVTDGFLENLKRGRLTTISARDYEAIRAYSLAACERQLTAVRADLSAVLEVLGRRS